MHYSNDSGELFVEWIDENERRKSDNKFFMLLLEPFKTKRWIIDYAKWNAVWCRVKNNKFHMMYQCKKNSEVLDWTSLKKS